MKHNQNALAANGAYTGLDSPSTDLEVFIAATPSTYCTPKTWDPYRDTSVKQVLVWLCAALAKAMVDQEGFFQCGPSGCWECTA